MSNTGKIRIYELSKILNVSNKDIMDLIAREFPKVDIKSHSSTIEGAVAARVREYFKTHKPSRPAPPPRSSSPSPSSNIARPPAPPQRPPTPLATPLASKTPLIQRPQAPGVPFNRMQRPGGGYSSQQSQSSGATSRPVMPSFRPGEGPGALPQRHPPRQAAPLPAQTMYRAPITPAASTSSGNPAAPQSTPPSLSSMNGEQAKPPASLTPSSAPSSSISGASLPVAPSQTPQVQGVSTPPGQVSAQPMSSRPIASASPSSSSVYMPAGPSRPIVVTPAPSRTADLGRSNASRPDASPSARPEFSRPDAPRGPSRGPGGGQGRPGGRGRSGRGGGRASFSGQDDVARAQGSAGNRRAEPEPPPTNVSINEPLSVAALADVLQLKPTEIIRQLFMKGVMVTVNQSLDVPTARSIATALNYIVDIPEETEAVEVTNVLDSKKASTEDGQHLVSRAPVVSIMGHVDHGKTSLLDAIRQTRHKIVDTEAGGITQSIGAYRVDKDGQQIVFLDTPGHEAFTSMRLRGAKSTDIAILVVAADDGVMPQTIEAISHAKAAGIPIIVAINKIDKADADPDRVLVQLSEHGLVAEKYGGDALTVEVSALQKLGIDDVLETILLVSELLDLKANPERPADGVIIEAQLDKRKGPVATALVQNGTLRVGDWVLIGAVGGRVRALVNDAGERIEQAGPSTPVEILGLSEVPRAGDPFEVTDEKVFKKLLDEAKLAQREETLEARSRLRGVLSRNSMAIGESDGPRAFNIIVKGDTHGSAEAVSQSLQTLKGESIEPTILHVGSGNVSENDVMLARASGAIIIAFNVKEDPNALKVLENDPVQIYKFDVIYHIHDSIKKLMLGQLTPDMEDVKTGEAEVRQLFPVGKSVVAGCMVLDGKITRNAKLRVMREGKQIFEGPIETLRRFKDDAKEVASGYECGIAVAKFNDLQIGDRLEAIVQEARLRTTL